MLNDKKMSKANLLKEMRAETLFKDDFWHLLFSTVRDKECSPIDGNTYISVVESGRSKQMGLRELEERFISENKDKLD